MDIKLLHKKPQLVLDIGGVLINNLDDFWKNTADSASIPYEELRGAYKMDMRKKLWYGEATEQEFWCWLTTRFPAIREDAAKGFLYDCMFPLRAYPMLSEWSRIADVHILSNHRGEWIRPVLGPVMPFLKKLVISAEIGLCKPDLRMYRYLEEHMEAEGAVLFVDDVAANLAAASSIGWKTLLADQAGHWTERVQSMLVD